MAKNTKKEIGFEVACPECGGMLRIDPVTQSVISHTGPPRKRTFEDLQTAASAMREQDQRRESIFKQSLEAQKNQADIFDKKFAEALRKAKESPDTGKPLREFDLD
ncbi:MAG: hypothetical protein JSS87_04015 [Acidobacteria bacterium]|nr:hypothetical protein [Acidobacteriota bacterium]